MYNHFVEMMGCLDETHFKARVRENEKVRYKNRK